MKSLSAIEMKLLESACRVASETCQRVRTSEEIVAAMESPDWPNDRRGVQTEWEGYVWEPFDDLWGELTLETKLAVFIEAARRCDLYVSQY